MSDDHTPDHDGIEEHDNHLPNWWLATLFGAIVFALFYWFYYQTFAIGPSSREALASEEQALRALRKAPAVMLSDDDVFKRSKDAAAVARGKDIFAANCVACHGVQAQGIIGPNLTDAYWLHGGRPSQIYNTVTTGILDKGMLAWGPVLGDEKVQDVVAFVLTLKNTNTPGGKPPQGDKEP
jgi:cytochrome c oxidase cbb3-type subunit 3